MYGIMKSSREYCTIYIVRHGESEWNVRGLIEGRGDSLLTYKGEMQAFRLAKELKLIKFDVLFSSHLKRAKRTAEIIALEHNLTTETTRALVERDFGRLEGKSGKQLKILAYLQKLGDPSTYKSYGMESDEEILDRMMAFIHEIVINSIGKTVLLVTHGSLIRVLLVHLGYVRLEELPPRSVANMAFVKLEANSADFLVKETKGINFNLDPKKFA